MADDEKNDRQAGDAADLIQTYFTDLTRAAIDAQANFALKIYGVAAQTARGLRSPQAPREDCGARSKTSDADQQSSRRDWRKEFDAVKEKSREAEEREITKIDEVLGEEERAGKRDDDVVENGEARKVWRANRPPQRRVCVFDFRKLKAPTKGETADVVLDAARKLSRGRLLAGPRDGAAADEAIAELYAEFPWFQVVLADLLAQLRAAAENGDGAAFRPMLLVGPPGVGKTRFATRLASALGVHFERHDCAGQDDVRALAGTARGWASAEFAAPVRALLSCDHANPLLFLDEIEKGGVRWKHYRPSSLVLPWLEPSSAATWQDPLLMAPVDLSRVLWIFGANDLHGLPAPFLSRVSIYKIPTPGPEHFDALFASIVADIEADERKRAGSLWMMKDEDVEERDTLEPEAIEYLRARFMQERLSPRELARLVKRAADATPRKRAVAVH